MRFEFSADSRETVLRAVFEDDDHYTGERQEGVGTMIRYTGQDITFDYAVDSIHPDLLGLLCMIIYYPFIGTKVTFPMAVSPRLETAFGLPPFKSKFQFTNVDDTVPMYRGSRMALSFGGGIDSSAVRTMLPEAFIVHEAHIRDDRVVPSHAHTVVRDLGPEQGRIVTTNQRYVSRPGGWHGWACSVATSLLMATDKDFGIILTGSTLANTLLYNGSKYWDRFAARRAHGFTGNYWQSAFNSVGIPMFSPVCGASEYLTMSLALDLIHRGEVVYCMESSGNACLECWKCFRRDVIRTVVDSRHEVDWKPYDRLAIHNFLERRPLYYGHIFSYARDRSKSLPRFMLSRLEDIPGIKSDWPMRVHTGAFGLCDDDWRSTISERVLQHLDPMEPEHVAEMESWDQTRVQQSPPAARRLPGPNIKHGVYSIVRRTVARSPALSHRLQRARSAVRRIRAGLRRQWGKAQRLHRRR